MCNASPEEALPATALLQRRVPQGAGGKLAARQAEKLRKAAEKAEKARTRIEQRKREWDELWVLTFTHSSEWGSGAEKGRWRVASTDSLFIGTLQHFVQSVCCISLSYLSYAAKPSEDYEDPEDIRAIQLAKENMGDFKLKTAKDFTVPEHLRMNVEKKTAQVVELEEQVRKLSAETVTNPPQLSLFIV